MLHVDAKLLIVVMGVLLLGVAVKLTMPQIQEGLNLDLILTGTGGFGMLVYFHFAGYLEGYNKGYSQARQRAIIEG